ncbi:MAG: SDR family oxidoreductase [Lentisphaerae bacterium]|nr:SDR family oxidoreductase [Lentisphaerota bacterium]
MNTVYLVTGGCGFIGSHLCERLAAEGAAVRVLDNLSSGYEANLAAVRGRVDLRRGDIRDPDAVGDAMQGATYVFHLAALVSVVDSIERPLDNHAINIAGTLNVLEAARRAGVRRVVLASSAAVYGNTPELPKRESMLPQPESPYAAAKLAGEALLSVYSRQYGLPGAALRYFNVYGPRQDPKSIYSGVISKFADDAVQGRASTVFGDGRQTRDFVYVRDVVEANLLALRSRAAGRGEVFNIGSGATASLLDLLDAFSRLAGRTREPVFKDARPGDIRHSAASIENARRALRFEPAYTLERGLADLWASLGTRRKTRPAQ